MQAATPIIKVIKPGTFTSVEGKKVTFSLADLESAAAAYDPEGDPAPLVIGHPTMEAPAYGWARSLRVEDGHLVAEPDPDKLEPAFAEAVRTGRYRKVSGRFYLPDSPGNPKPGNFYLQHIGFLGAAAPAVKGLGTVNFSEAGEELVTIDQDPPAERARGDQDPPAERAGGDQDPPAEEPTTNQVSPGGDATHQEQSMTKTAEHQEASFAEREAELNDREASFAEREQEIAAKEAEVATREAAARQIQHESNVSFAEGLIGAGRLAPAGKGLVVGLLDTLSGAGGDSISFGEGVAPDAALRKLLEGAQPLVSFAEHAKPEDDDKGDGKISFAAPAGYTTDASSLELHRKALELQSGDPNLSYLEAVKRAGS